MIYTFKVHASDAALEPLETTHVAHGADVLAQAKTLLGKYPGCKGVEVLMLGSRLFFIPYPDGDETEARRPSEAVRG